MLVYHVFYILSLLRITRLILGDEPLISEVVLSQLLSEQDRGNKYSKHLKIATTLTVRNA
jgi:hypothetical protein